MEEIGFSFNTLGDYYEFENWESNNQKDSIDEPNWRTYTHTYHLPAIFDILQRIDLYVKKKKNIKFIRYTGAVEF
jgi:hypothetical protein